MAQPVDPPRLRPAVYLGDGQWPGNLKPAADVAAATGLSVARVCDLADAQLIPHWRLDGGAPLFKVAEVREWLAKTQLLKRCDGKPLPLQFILTTTEPAVASEVPPALRAMAHELHVLPITGQGAGVYFLCKDDRIVYVGQSVCPTARVAQHLASGKVFDRVFVYPCLPEHLNLLEGALIRALRPEENGNNAPMTDAALVADLYPSIATCTAAATDIIVTDADA